MYELLSSYKSTSFSELSLISSNSSISAGPRFSQLYHCQLYSKVALYQLDRIRAEVLIITPFITVQRESLVGRMFGEFTLLSFWWKSLANNRSAKVLLIIQLLLQFGEQQTIRRIRQTFPLYGILKIIVRTQQQLLK